MIRRDFINNGIALSMGGQIPFRSKTAEGGIADNVVIEKYQPGKPHQGKVLAAIQPHCDDLPLFAGGTIAKLIKEGYEGYLIRTTNDDHAGKGETVGDVIKNNSHDNQAVAKALGLKKVFDLGYRNHMMDNYSLQEIRGRLIFLFRLRGIPSDKESGKPYKLEWSERFHYIGADPSLFSKYIQENATRIKGFKEGQD